MKLNKQIISTHNWNLGDTICGLSNLYRQTEIDDTYTVLLYFGHKPNMVRDVYRVFRKPSKGHVELFCSEDGKEYTDQLGSMYSQIFSANIANMFSKPLTLEKNIYNKINLSAVDTDYKIPTKKYVTWQFDALTGAKSQFKQFTQDELDAIRNKYIDLGFEVVSIEGTHKYADGFDRAIKLLQGARYHIGLCSGMAHLAQCLNKKTHLYSSDDFRYEMISRKHLYGVGTSWQTIKLFAPGEL